MNGGDASIPAPAGSLVIVDPRSKVLREMPHFAEYSQWKKEQAEKKAKVAKQFARDRNVGGHGFPRA